MQVRKQRLELDRTTPISQSALDKNPMPRHLFEGNPVGEVTIRRGTDTPVRPGLPKHQTLQIGGTIFSSIFENSLPLSQFFVLIPLLSGGP